MARFGLTLEQEGTGFESIRSLAAAGEELQYDSIWLGDHFFYSEQPFLECWTTLSALSCATKKIKLGTQVLCNSYRHPPLVAKMAATLDVISGGRLILGLGAGWHKREYEAYGIPFRRDGIRVSRLEEAVKVIKKMWTQPATTFKGKHYVVKDARCEPKPIQKPHPPIWIGGNGNRILRIAARTRSWNISLTSSSSPIWWNLYSSWIIPLNTRLLLSQKRMIRISRKGLSCS